MTFMRKITLFFLNALVRKNKAFIYREAEFLNDFMNHLMKPKNTGGGWTREEKVQLKADLRHLSLYVPFLIIFLLPGGSLLLPLLAEVLDRRGKQRDAHAKVSTSH